VLSGCAQSSSTVQDDILATEGVQGSQGNQGYDSAVVVTDVPLEVRDTRSEIEQTESQLIQLIADGTYTEDVTYAYHSGTERVTISITTENDVVVAASVTPNDPNRTSERYINGVNAALPELVIGKKINEIELPKQISGSSLTTAALGQQLKDLVEKY